MTDRELDPPTGDIALTGAPPPQPPQLPDSAADPLPALAEQIVELSALTGGLAHEIRNPLSTLKMNLQLLDEDWRLLESADRGRQDDSRDIARRSRRRLQTLVEESNHLERILEDFLQYIGKRELERARCDLNTLVRELLDFYRPQAETHGVHLRMDPAERPLICNIDAGVIKQAMLNLLINAQQAMPQGGDLCVRVGVHSDAVARIDVIDTGPGIPEEQQERIFRAYHSTKKGGTGLGLATTRQIVREHGGRIHIFSDPPHGSCFTILLPRVPAN